MFIKEKNNYKESKKRKTNLKLNSNVISAVLFQSLFL